MQAEPKISSLNHLIEKVFEDYDGWQTIAYPWFRGERTSDTPLLPKLYRSYHNENRLLQQFRVKAPAIAISGTPPIERTDQWLFLARHVGLPTRLLDWTEGLLLALYFALNCQEPDEPIVYMLNPHELNKKSNSEAKPNVFDLTWLNRPEIPARKEDIYALMDKPNRYMNLKKYSENYLTDNLGNINIKAAWGAGRVNGTEYPVAILPTYVHPRMTTQKSCFTIWGNDRRSLTEMDGVDDKVLKKYVIEGKNILTIKAELRLLGITDTSLFPDLDNLSKELGGLF